MSGSPDIYLTAAKAVETSVTSTNSPSQDYTNLDCILYQLDLILFG